MKLYDESIAGFESLLKKFEPAKLSIDSVDSDWPDIGNENMILRGDMAYELGGDMCFALSGLAITVDQKQVPCDEVLLYGPDLSEIKQDVSYARIAIVRVKEDGMGEGNTLYNAIRKIEYVRYHLNPKGYMMRISASNDREPARVGKEALAKGLDFAKVGKLFVKAYHENPKIEAVKLIFITEPNFDYKELETQIKKNEQITAAIDHIMKNLIMDCKACNLKEVCDEVEGMKELHFAQAGIPLDQASK